MAKGCVRLPSGERNLGCRHQGGPTGPRPLGQPAPTGRRQAPAELTGWPQPPGCCGAGHEHDGDHAVASGMVRCRPLYGDAARRRQRPLAPTARPARGRQRGSSCRIMHRPAQRSETPSKPPAWMFVCVWQRCAGRSRLVLVSLGLRLLFLGDDLHAQVDALVADVDAWSGDELHDGLLAFAAEGTLQQVTPFELLPGSLLAGAPS